MYRNPAATWFYNGRMSTPEICEHCGRILRHEKWCITRDAGVRYAYAVVTDGEKLTLRDRLILHALGVDWGAAPCTGDFQQRTESNVVSAMPRSTDR
ncbi:MAG TPA: hypothetical protein VMP68_25710 [Candidatus Eisenbacteria bacterium]|nr:hypothetical protein [Candidatus Eisenbacteria bacterium]